MHFRRNSQVRKEEAALVEQAQALLSGTFGTIVYANWQRRPAWVYVNQLAHADASTLDRLAQRQTTSHPASWTYACALLAGEVLELAATGRGLTEVQRALVPLELELLDNVHSDDLTPAVLVRLATQALAAAGP
jgi:hypothetical protein